MFVVQCSEAGQLALVLNGNQVAAVSCPDSAYSTFVVGVPRADLVADGWVVGKDVTLALHGAGGSQGFAGLLVYGQ